MPVKLASWLLKTSSLKAMAQVLERPTGECECQRPSSREKPVAYATVEVKTERQGH